MSEQRLPQRPTEAAIVAEADLVLSGDADPNTASIRRELDRFDPKRDSFFIGVHCEGGILVEVGDMHFYSAAEFDYAAAWMSDQDWSER